MKPLSNPENIQLRRHWEYTTRYTGMCSRETGRLYITHYMMYKNRKHWSLTDSWQHCISVSYGCSKSCTMIRLVPKSDWQPWCSAAPRKSKDPETNGFKFIVRGNVVLFWPDNKASCCVLELVVILNHFNRTDLLQVFRAGPQDEKQAGRSQKPILYPGKDLSARLVWFWVTCV